MIDLVEEATRRFAPLTASSIEIQSLLSLHNLNKSTSAVSFVSKEASPLLEDLEQLIKNKRSYKTIQETIENLNNDIALSSQHILTTTKLPDELASFYAEAEHKKEMTAYNESKKELEENLKFSEKVLQITAPRAFDAIDNIATSNALSSVIIEKITVTLRKKIVHDFKKAAESLKELNDNEPKLLTPQEWREKEIAKYQARIDSDKKIIAENQKDLDTGNYLDSDSYTSNLQIIKTTKKDFNLK